MSGPGGTYLPPVLGKPKPMDSGVDLPFQQGLRDHKVLLQRCVVCRGWQWPPEVICHRCHSFEVAWEEPPSLVGEVFTWTRVRHPARDGLAQSVPYVIVVTELASAGGARLVGNLLGDPEQNVRTGMAVVPVFEDHNDDAMPFTLLHWRAV